MTNPCLYWHGDHISIRLGRRDGRDVSSSLLGSSIITQLPLETAIDTNLYTYVVLHPTHYYWDDPLYTMLQDAVLGEPSNENTQSLFSANIWWYTTNLIFCIWQRDIWLYLRGQCAAKLTYIGGPNPLNDLKGDQNVEQHGT